MYKINEKIQTDLPQEAIEELEKIVNEDPDSIRMIKSSLSNALIQLVICYSCDGENYELKEAIDGLAIACEQLFKLLNYLDDFSSVLDRSILDKEKRGMILNRLKDFETVET